MRKKPLIRLESYGFSDIGPVRPNNEDVWLSMPRYRFFALADGMGGHNGGEVAAKETIDFLSSSIKSLIHPQKKAKIPTKDLIYHLRSVIDQANAKIYDLSREKVSLKGMGTTLCCLYLYEDSVIYAHVGDSRIYRYRNKELKQLTQDHTLFQESYAKSATKHIITRAIGTCNKVEPEISLVTVQQEDLFFMCTDGLSDFVSVQEMESFLQEKGSLKKKVKSLVLHAKQKGSSDNITALLVKVK